MTVLNLKYLIRMQKDFNGNCSCMGTCVLHELSSMSNLINNHNSSAQSKYFDANNQNFLKITFFLKYVLKCIKSIR